jgi:transcriptional regulator with XRE-family HTH domain
MRFDVESTFMGLVNTGLVNTGTYGTRFGFFRHVDSTSVNYPKDTTFFNRLWNLAKNILTRNQESFTLVSVSGVNLHKRKYMMPKRKYEHGDKRGRRSSVRPDLNLSELAKSVNVGPDYLSKLFRGIGTPSVPLAQALAEKMGIPLTQLLSELEKQKQERKLGN